MSLKYSRVFKNTTRATLQEMKFIFYLKFADLRFVAESSFKRVLDISRCCKANGNKKCFLYERGKQKNHDELIKLLPKIMGCRINGSRRHWCWAINIFHKVLGIAAKEPLDCAKGERVEDSLIVTMWTMVLKERVEEEFSEAIGSDGG